MRRVRKILESSSLAGECALLVTGLLVLGVATALSAAESAADAATLHAVGARPRSLRGLAAARSAYLALLGCLLAVPAGLLPLVGLLAAADVPLAFRTPWAELALVVGGLPCLAWAGTWLLVDPTRPSLLPHRGPP